MQTFHKIILGNCVDMHELYDKSVHLVVTSPPYYNAPFDYPGLFKDYDEYLDMMRKVAKELLKVLAQGRIAAFVTDDMLVEGEKYPVVADITKIMMDAGFKYRDKIIWKKPEGYTRISRRSGVLLQNPYPMYFYPDNLQETILIFQHGEFDYSYVKKLPEEIRKSSEVDLTDFSEHKWNLTVWEITNVLPLPGRLEEGIAAFPEEIPQRLITLFSFAGETVLDPFLGSGTTMKVARQLDRNGIGYEIDLELKRVILEKVGYYQKKLDLKDEDEFEIIEREDARRLRTWLQDRILRKKTEAVIHKRGRHHRNASSLDKFSKRSKDGSA